MSMGGGSSAPAPTPESEHSRTMARIAQQQYDNYTTNYKPFEDKLIAKAKESPLAGLGTASTAFEAANAMTAGTADRNLARYGTSLNDAQRGSMSRLSGLNTAAATGKGVTGFGQTAVDQNMQLQGQLAGIGRAASGQAMEGLGTANSNYMAQQQQYQQAQAAQNQANMAQQNQMVGTAGSLAMMYAMSDADLKDNIEVIPHALDAVDALSGVTWEWNDTATTTNGLHGPSAGVIAQDVLEVLPEAVEQVGEHLAVNYAGVIGLLVNAVKELRAEVAELKGAA